MLKEIAGWNFEKKKRGGEEVIDMSELIAVEMGEHCEFILLWNKW